VYGVSSGAVLALDAAADGLAIETLAGYEPPFIVDDSRPPLSRDYVPELDELVAAGRRGDAVKLFMSQVGMPRIMIAVSRFMPAWSKLEAVAHTLAYDAAIMGDTQLGKPLPADRWAAVTIPTLLMVGGKSPAWMQRGVRELEDLLPRVQRRTLDGQTHMVKPKVLAPVLDEFFAARAIA
jgi:pimeloyl-ACP methyl ester carboxylesterase